MRYICIKQKQIIMTTLETKISNAQTSNELQTLTDSIKRQDNGFRNSLANHLQNAFWYHNLIDDLQAQKDFMLRVCGSYSDSMKELN